ncbi:SHOCT domain-containing protein [Halalkalibacterium ligniniphilum]|uniref:SHOCT domain-containing protein n=1 Tax=Halalkalibacterium ligniniphilum TaxID=1134413 RepID=UPI00037E3783|nr:SHOCT domain-containing protein [Halalkalibacterium ligniniphilum]
MGIMDLFKSKGFVITVTNGQIGNKKESSYAIEFTNDKGIVKVKKRNYYFLGFSEKTLSEMSAAKTLSGAAIGTFFAPGIGTLIGGAIGAKKKKKTTYTMAFMDVESKEKFMVEANLFAASEADLKKLEAHPIAKEATLNEEKPTVSKVDEIREFKKLLDEGIITQDEFDKKKAELLG